MATPVTKATLDSSVFSVAHVTPPRRITQGRQELSRVIRMIVTVAKPGTNLKSEPHQNSYRNSHAEDGRDE